MAGRDDESVGGYTQCPSCRTVFRVQLDVLRGSAGRARCGLCGYGFNAAARWRPDLPPGSERQPVSSYGALHPATTSRSEYLLRGAHRRPPRKAATGAASQRATARRAEISREASASSAATSDREAPAASGREAGESAGWRVVTDAELETPSPGRRWPWCAAAVALTVALACQLGWFQREALARYEATRPWLTATCRYLPCELAPRRQPEAVAVVERVLREHPQRQGAMVLTGTIANTADVPQPWPQLGLRLSALNGDIIGEQWLAPQAYRARKPAARGADELMLPDKHYAVRFAFRRPEREVAGFELDFR